MKNLQKLVSIKSDLSCDEILSFLQSELKDKVCDIKIFDENNSSKVMFVGINTKLADISSIVLSGHLDTVSANIEQYNTNPFELTEIDGNAYGLGTIDMKSFTAIILDNIETLKTFATPLVAVLTTDEETKMESISLAIKKMKELNIKPKFTVVGEPINEKFCLSANADYEVNVKFVGKSCHSSKPENGVNAICACAKLIGFVEEHQKMFDLTSNCGVVKGGEVTNKVPDYSEMSFDLRSLDKNAVECFLKDVESELIRLKNEYVGLECMMKVLFYIPVFKNVSDEKIKNIANTLDIETASFLGGCEAGYFTSYCGDAVIFGVGDLELAHKPNEYVKIESYKKYSTKLLELLKLIEKYY